ncbi:MAG: ExbD/TolR family protein [Gammaproteobacteria bacterium]
MSMNLIRGTSSDDELSGYHPMAEINVTPLVDVMLVLLIIFMITAPLMMAQLPIELPKTSAAELGKPKQPLIVSLDAKGQYYLSGKPVAAVDLPARLATLASQDPDEIVYVRADKTIPYGRVMAFLGEVGQSGFYKISLISKQASESPGAQSNTQTPNTQPGTPPG